MALYAQIARGNQSRDDVTVYNNSGVDIPAGYCVNYETVSGHPDAVALPSNGGGSLRLAGVTVTTIKANGYGTMCRRGPAVVYAHNAIASGEFVQCYDVTAHLGEVVTVNRGATIEAGTVLGQCIYLAASDGDACLVDVNISLTTTAA